MLTVHINIALKNKIESRGKDVILICDINLGVISIKLLTEMYLQYAERLLKMGKRIIRATTAGVKSSNNILFRTT